MNDIFNEIIKYLDIRTLLNFGLTSRSNYNLIQIYLNNINEDKFITNHNLTVENKSYNIYFDYYIYFGQFKDFELVYNIKRKNYYMKYIDNFTIFKIYNKNIIISNCKSKDDAIKKLTRFFKEYIPNIKTFRIVPLATTLISYDTFCDNKNFEGYYINTRHSHVCGYRLLIKDTSIMVFTTKSIIHYSKFKEFYIIFRILTNF